MKNRRAWESRHVLFVSVAVFAAVAATARSQELIMPARLSALASPGAKVVWGQFEFSEFVVTGPAAGVTVRGTSQGNLHGLSFSIDPGSLIANGSGIVSRLDLRYVVRPTAGSSSIGGVELTTAGETTGLGFAINHFTFYDAAFTGIATPLGLGIARYMGPTRDVELLREATAALTVSGSLSARTVLPSDYASMSLSTHRYALASDILAGDYDLNGRVDGADFLKWKISFGQGPEDGVSLIPHLDADGNGDGKVDLADYTVWRDNLGSLIGPPGDFNRDGNVDGADYLLWQRSFGSSDPATDANGNGIVDLADYTIWRDNLGASGYTSASHAVSSPEPSAGLMGFIVGATALAVARVRMNRVAMLLPCQNDIL